jgi:hypothetical protein
VSGTHDPWALPSAGSFLADARELLGDGGGMLLAGPSMPADVCRALLAFLRGRDGGLVVRRLAPQAGLSPATSLAREFGSAGGDVPSLASDIGLADHVALVEVPAIPDGQIHWEAFLNRFLSARRQQVAALSVLLICRYRPSLATRVPIVKWGGRFRRHDITIWADLHAPLDRAEPLAALAEALAVELGGWRLDLAASIAAASVDDLLDPLALLESWQGDAILDDDCIGGVRTSCSIALLKGGETAELRQRIWRAQLRALFPWIEELRQRVISRHRRQLIVDQQQRLLGIRSLEEIEFGGLAHQLRSKVSPVEADLLRVLSRIRNDLAHHRIVAAADLSVVLQNLKRAGYG